MRAKDWSRVDASSDGNVQEFPHVDLNVIWESAGSCVRWPSFNVFLFPGQNKIETH